MSDENAENNVERNAIKETDIKIDDVIEVNDEEYDKKY